MFKRREKKIFPPGTFITTPLRVLCIIHLCLACIFLLWTASKPFMEDLFQVKSEMLLYDSILKKETLFNTLSETEQIEIKSSYGELQNKLQHSFTTKLAMMVKLILKMGTLEQAWLYFSLVLPILVLLKVEGATQACCLLPIIAIAYIGDHYNNRQERMQEPDFNLFPKEEFILHNYAEGSENGSIFDEQQRLLKGWQRYLIEKWGGEIPSDDEKIFQEQYERAQFAFTHKRIELRQNVPLLAIEKTKPGEAPPILMLYLVWNTIFAMTAARYTNDRIPSKKGWEV